MEQAKQNQGQKNPLDRPARDHTELRALLTSPSVLEQIKMTLPAHMKPERLAKILLSATLKTPKLMQCNQLSLLRTLANLSELGLEPGGARPLVHLIPFEVSQGKGPDGNWLPKRMDVNIIVDYRGYLELFRRSGVCKDFDLDVVYEGEKFEYKKGFSASGDDARCFRHEPDWKRDRSTLEGALVVYFIAYFKDGGRHVEVMSVPEVLKIRDRSEGWKAAVAYKKTDKSPWFTDPVRMALKTVIRRASNFVPLSPEAKDALDIEHNGEVAEEAAAALNTIRKPPSGDGAASAWAAASAQQQPEDAEIVDPETGEVPMSDAEKAAVESAQGAGQQVDGVEEQPPADPIDNLLWRVKRSTAEQLVELTAEAGKLSKEESRRMEVAAAISARRKEVAQ